MKSATELQGHVSGKALCPDLSLRHVTCVHLPSGHTHLADPPATQTNHTPSRNQVLDPQVILLIHTVTQAGSLPSCLTPPGPCESPTSSPLSHHPTFQCGLPSPLTQAPDNPACQTLCVRAWVLGSFIPSPMQQPTGFFLLFFEI